MKIKEKDLKVVKLSWITFIYTITLLAGYRLVVFILKAFSAAESQEQKLLWIIILGLFCFAWKPKLQRFNSSVRSVCTE